LADNTTCVLVTTQAPEVNTAESSGFFTTTVEADFSASGESTTVEASGLDFTTVVTVTTDEMTTAADIGSGATTALPITCPRFSTPSQNECVPVLTVTVSLRFDIEWNPALSNITSSSALAFSSVVRNIVDILLNQTDFFLESIETITFRQGSVVADVTMSVGNVSEVNAVNTTINDVILASNEPLITDNNLIEVYVEGINECLDPSQHNCSSEEECVDITDYPGFMCVPETTTASATEASGMETTMAPVTVPEASGLEPTTAETTTTTQEASGFDPTTQAIESSGFETTPLPTTTTTIKHNFVFERCIFSSSFCSRN
jgi:hypothetical protein